MQPQNKLVIAATAVIILAAVAGGSLIYSGPASPADFTPGNVYIDGNLGFQISYPDGWIAEKNPDGVAVLSLAPSGAIEGSGVKVYLNRIELDSTSINTVKNSIDARNMASPEWNPDVYKSVITKVGGFDAVLVDELTGYAEQGYSMYVLLDNRAILEFSGSTSDRDIFLTLKRI